MRREIIVENGAATAGDVDSDYVIPDNKSLIPLYGQVILTTDATVADRRVVVRVLDVDDNVIIDFHSGAVVAASQSNQHHEFMQGIFRETSFIGDAIQVPIGIGLVMQSGWKLRATIENGVAGDSFTSHFAFEKNE